jgi:hypothetical protein
MAIDTVGKILIGGILAITGAEATLNVVKYVKARKSRIKAEQELEETRAKAERILEEQRERKEAEDFERWKKEQAEFMEEARKQDKLYYGRLINSAKRMCKMVEEES